MAIAIIAILIIIIGIIIIVIVVIMSRAEVFADIPTNPHPTTLTYPPSSK